MERETLAIEHRSGRDPFSGYR